MSELSAVAVFAPCGCLYRWHPEGYWYNALASKSGQCHDASFHHALNADPARSYSLAAAGMAMAKMGVG